MNVGVIHTQVRKIQCTISSEGEDGNKRSSFKTFTGLDLPYITQKLKKTEPERHVTRNQREHENEIASKIIRSRKNLNQKSVN